jgi:hypothetical protein
MRQRLGIGIIAVAALFWAAGSRAAEDRAAVPKRDGRRAGESWLAVVDKGSYGTSWEQAAAKFRLSVPREAWVSTLREKRQPLGTVLSRTLQSADYSTTLPGAPAGEYVTLRFDTSFEKQSAMIETLVLAPEAGTWRVLGYHVTPGLTANEQADEQFTAAKVEARKRAEAWLAVLDKGAYGEAWDAAAAPARQAVPREKWVRTLQQARQPLGQVKSRVFKSAEHSTSLPGAPPGEYVTVLYDTAFATRGAAVETVTLRSEGGTWRVAGYFFQ